MGRRKKWTEKRISDRKQARAKWYLERLNKERERLNQQRERNNRSNIYLIPSNQTINKSLIVVRMTCRICQHSRFDTQEEVANHLIKKHSNLDTKLKQLFIYSKWTKNTKLIERFVCKLCHKSYFRKNSADQHHKKYHPILFEPGFAGMKQEFIKKRYGCKLCQEFKFVKTENLIDEHIWSDHNEVIVDLRVDANSVKARDLLLRNGINDYSHSTVLKKHVPKLPTEFFACCLCPHLLIDGFAEIKFHVRALHNVTDDVALLLIVAIPTSFLLQNYMNKNVPLNFNRFFIDCVCNYIAVPKALLSTPVIDNTYNDIMKLKWNAPTEENVDGETKLARIYHHNFRNHFKHKLVIDSQEEPTEANLDYGLSANYYNSARYNSEEERDNFYRYACGSASGSTNYYNSASYNSDEERDNFYRYACGSASGSSYM